MGLLAGGNKSSVVNEYDQTQENSFDNRQDNRDFSKTTFQSDSSTNVDSNWQNRESYESNTTNNNVVDFGAVDGGLDVATRAVDEFRGVVSDSVGLSERALDNGFNSIGDVLNFGKTAIENVFNMGNRSVQEVTDFGVEGLDFARDTGSDAFEMVNDTQDAAFNFSADTLNKSLDSIGGVLDLNGEIARTAMGLADGARSETLDYSTNTLRTVANMAADVATGGATSNNRSMVKALIVIGAVSATAFVAMAWSKRK